MVDRLVRFTESARDAIVLANQEALAMGSGYVGAEHMLLGLMREGMGMAGIILRTFGVKTADLEGLLGGGSQKAVLPSTRARLDLSPGLKRAINRAINEAHLADHPMVSTEHLLMGLIAQPESRAGRLLKQLEVPPELVENHVRQVLDDGQAVTLSADQRRYEFEARYKIERVVGIGSMSTVYRARDTDFHNMVRLVAIKEMLVEESDPAARSELIKNFRLEADILAALRHPFIPRFVDFFHTGERFYIVMEYILGQDLETVLSDEPGFLPVERVLDWGIQLCDVLSYLHNHPLHPIIFRDLKPSNIMIDQYDNIRLIDFNIARVLRYGRRSASAGTQGYAAPEQYHGEVTPQVDIYALGATLHHALTRRDPRQEKPFSFQERPPSRYNPQVQPRVVAILDRALAYRPEDRYRSIDEMREALMEAREAEAASGRTAAAGKPAAPGGSSPPSGRNS